MDWHRVIFLAHASEDKPKVLRLYNKLLNAGLEPWLDKKVLRPGEDWDMKIREAIKKANFFMACISSTSIGKKGYIQEERKRALDELARKKSSDVYFIPGLLEDVELPDISVGNKSLRDYHAVNLFEKKGVDSLRSC